MSYETLQQKVFWPKYRDCDRLRRPETDANFEVEEILWRLKTRFGVWVQTRDLLGPHFSGGGR